MEFKDMTTKILEYLDGELPTNEEKELFTALANDEELRSVMREHLTISRAIQADLQASQPPATATLNILNTLGLSILPNVQSSDNISISKNSWTKTKKLGIPILVGLLSSLLTFLTTYYTFKPQESANLSNKVIVQTPPIIISTVDNVVDKPSNRSFISILKKEQNYLANREQIEINANPNSQTFTLEPVETSSTLSSNYLSFKQNQNIETNIKPKTLSYQEPLTISFNKTQNKTIFFTLRGMFGKSFPNPSISSPESNNLFSNSSIGFYFTQSDNIKFGIEFGNEIFGLSYLNVKDGIEYTYEQRPKLYWGAVGGEYLFPIQFLDIPQLHPFVTILAGGSQIGGPLFKGIAGLKYRPIGSNFEMYLGGEGTLLFYQNQRNYYLTRKIGLTYGMSIIF